MTGESTVPADLAARAAAVVGDHKLGQLTNGEPFLALSDDASVLSCLSDRGIAGSPWSPALALTDDSNVVLVMCHRKADRSLRAQFANCRVLFVPIVAFDDDPDTVVYTVERILETDFQAGLEQNEAWLEMLRNKSDGVLHFTGPGTDLRCRIGDDIQVFTSVDLTIATGEWVSVADYCEVQLTAPKIGSWCDAFVVDGYAETVGVLAAQDARATPAGEERVARARRLRAELVENGPVRLEIRESALCSATAGDREYLEEISEVTNPDYGMHLTEFGLGSNTSIGPSVRWRLNSQLNEGAGTFHLGLGEGTTGAHMDFVVASARVE